MRSLGFFAGSVLLGICVFTTPGSAWALGGYPDAPLVVFIKVIMKTLQYAVLVIAWGCGFYYVVEGIVDAASAESNDTRERRKGVNKIFGGIILIGLGTIIKMVYNHFFG
ncbi:MAG: hypothetical protein QXO76_00940 [Thermoproteota archaeon]